MNISILTPTYNRGELLEKLYKSLLKNIETYKYEDELQVEWLIMNDGSEDNTKQIAEGFIEDSKSKNKEFKDNLEEKFHNRKIIVKYFEQENQGKMSAINNLVKHVSEEYMIDCDSDDYFIEYAFNVMKKAIDESKDDENLYGFGFLKYDEDRTNMGNNYKEDGHVSTMFDMYFKEGLTGEKAILFKSLIRKEYKHKLENDEKFITEARMYHEMDLKYNIKCYNSPVMICEYQEEGYTKNIIKQFKTNPYGYYKYFKEMFEHNMDDISFRKRLYAIKHYILFSVLTNNKFSKENINCLNSRLNKFLFVILYIPGKIKTNKVFKDENFENLNNIENEEKDKSLEKNKKDKGI